MAYTPEMDDYDRAKIFKILHFDGFLTQMLKSHKLKWPSLESFPYKNGKPDYDSYRKTQMQVLEQNNKLLKPFPIIIIDEAQDFETEWFSFLYKLFIDESTDFFVAADEKQNIYQRKMDEEKMPSIAGMKGRWPALKTSHRMTQSGLYLSIAFQHEFMKHYNADAQIQVNMLTISEKRHYYSVESLDYRQIYSYIQSFCNGNNPIPFRDICILATNIGVVRDIDQHYRMYGIPTHTMCETSEENKELRKKYGVDDNNASDEEKKKRMKKFYQALYVIRNYKKSLFNVNENALKICTVQSFKGLGIGTVVFIITGSDDEVNPEIIYAGITRTRENLLVISYRANQYQNFFHKELNEIKYMER